MQLGLFGSYDADAPRLAVLLAGLEALGHTVVACHEPLWPPGAARPALARAPWRLGARWLAVQRRLRARSDELRGVDAILVPYPGQADMPLARRVADWLGVPLLFDPFLSMFDTVVGDRALLKPTDPRARALGWLDRRALRLADRVLADTGPMADYYRELAGLAPQKLAVVPVGADGKVFAPVPEPETGVATVLFVGTMLPLHGVETIREAERLLAGDPRLRFQLVGPDNPVPFAQLPALMAAATICLGAFGESAKAARVVPHKVFQAAAVGRAVVTRDGPAVREAFGAESLVLVPPGDAKALAAALVALVEAPERRRALAHQAQAAFQARFDATAVATALVEALGRG
jgi:glycosyltransferase involved in cell wall biosynthesis